MHSMIEAISLFYPRTPLNMFQCPTKSLTVDKSRSKTSEKSITRTQIRKIGQLLKNTTDTRSIGQKTPLCKNDWSKSKTSRNTKQEVNRLQRLLIIKYKIPNHPMISSPPQQIICISRMPLLPKELHICKKSQK
jgi:hypothetical protein